MSNQSNPSNEKPRTFQDIIREIEQKSVGGGYIYRGEHKTYAEHPYNGKVSSSLWREFCIEEETFNIEIIQKEMVRAAKKHAGYLSEDSRANPEKLSVFARGLSDINIDHKILIDIQHYGGKTNLIDFTTDYFIALFFACDGCYDEDGRVVLQKTDEIIFMITHPRNPRHRVIAQKSIFTRPPKGFIEPREEEIVIIPASLKQDILGHLRNYHSISIESIYNDLHGFIRNQDIHGDAYTNFYRALACGDRQEWEKSITHYTKAIELKPEFVAAYLNRGLVYMKKENYEHAIADQKKAIDIKPDNPDAYFNLGMIYNQKKDFDLAIKRFTKAIELYPDFAGAYNHRGVVFRDKQSDYERAIEDFTKAIELKPEFIGEVYNNRGIAYRKKGDYEQAIEDHTEAIRLNTNSAAIYYYNRSVVWLIQQIWKKARKDLTDAKDLKNETVIIDEFQEDYTNVADFEQKHGVELPKDIAAMLTQQ